ncbi:N-acetylmuramoyl-L-alanine amidase [Rothia sp. HSID18067]|nr:N-acetylmuramoyl-L-alanine amidase [Rothia sp. HSID18067]
MYFALKHAGMLPANTAIGNTDSLFGSLERAGWTQVRADASGNIPARRGDVFIWGVRGASSGASGHTCFFCNDSDNIIHCNYGFNGITVNPHDVIWGYNGRPAVTIYRPPAEGPSADEVYRDTRRAVDDVLNTEFVRQGENTKEKFKPNNKTTPRAIIEWSDENFLRVQKRLDEVDRTLHSTQAE